MACEAMITRSSSRSALAWWAIAAGGLAFGIAVASSFVMIAVVSVMLLRLLCAHPAVHYRLAARAQERARLAARNQRDAKLEDACISRDELVELTEIVDRVAEVAPAEYERLELEQLLDRYVELVVTRRIAAERMARADRLGAYAHLWGAPSDRRRTIDEQRQAARSTCAAQLAALDDDIAQVAELIRLYGERATMPELGYMLEDDGVSRRLELMEPSTESQVG